MSDKQRHDLSHFSGDSQILDLNYFTDPEPLE